MDTLEMRTGGAVEAFSNHITSDLDKAIRSVVAIRVPELIESILEGTQDAVRKGIADMMLPVSRQAANGAEREATALANEQAEEMLTRKQAAAEYGVSYSWIQKLERAGKLEALSTPAGKLLSRAGLEAVLGHRKKGRRAA